MNCSYNNMTKLPSNILPGSEQLILTGNNLVSLESLDDKFVGVTKFNFRGCNIKHLSDKAAKILLLNTVDLKLSKNKLKQIPKVFQTVKSQTKVWLAENPLECHCDMMWMREWLQNDTNVMDKENITCALGKWKGELPSFCSFMFESEHKFPVCESQLNLCRNTHFALGHYNDGLYSISHLDWNCHRSHDSVSHYHSLGHLPKMECH